MMVSKGKYSHAFVIPAFGDSPFLEACLNSLRSQTSASPILLTTSTPSAFLDEVAERFDVELRVNSCRGGIGADWNFALEATSARYVTLAHQDDVYLESFAAECLDLLFETEAAICFTGYTEVDDRGAPIDSKISRVKHFIEWAMLGAQARPGRSRMRAFLSFGNPLPCSTVTYDRQRLQRFRFSEDLASNLDWDAWLRLLDSGVEFARIRRRLVGRRHNSLTETSRLIRDGRRAREDALMFGRLWPPIVAAALSKAYRLGY
jgi:glycosyltransferase involved in cell wall biosynthesis